MARKSRSDHGRLSSVIRDFSGATARSRSADTLSIRQNSCTAVAHQRVVYSSLSLFTSAVTKEVPCGSDNLLEYHGLSGIYTKFMARGPDAFLKGLPSELDFRR